MKSKVFSLDQYNNYIYILFIYLLFCLLIMI